MKGLSFSAHYVGQPNNIIVFVDSILHVVRLGADVVSDLQNVESSILEEGDEGLVAEPVVVVEGGIVLLRPGHQVHRQPAALRDARDRVEYRVGKRDVEATGFSGETIVTVAKEGSFQVLGGRVRVEFPVL